MLSVQHFLRLIVRVLSHCEKSDIQCLTFMDFTLVRATCPLRHVIVSHVSARVALFACALLAFRRFDALIMHPIRTSHISAIGRGKFGLCFPTTDHIRVVYALFVSSRVITICLVNISPDVIGPVHAILAR